MAVQKWPAASDALVDAQTGLGRATPEPWAPTGPIVVGGCFVCFGGRRGPDRSGEPGWASAVATRGDGSLEVTLISGAASTPYEPGLLALREGALLEGAVRALGTAIDVLLVNATGRDHPRRAGLAVHLGAVLELPTIGVTHRPLVARGAWPPDERGALSSLELDGDVVGYWLRTRAGRRPIAVHAAWRTDSDVAADIVRRSVRKVRTPEPIRRARRAARLARAQTTSPDIPPSPVTGQGSRCIEISRQRRS